MESKKSKKVIIIISIIAALAVVAAVVVLTTGKGRALKKQLNLGQKYLAEMNYEEAIAVFEKALEIDPMSADAYVGIADAYIAMANEKIDAEVYDGALSILNEAKTKLEHGIEILSGAGNDTSMLEEKLSEIDEIESEIARIQEEQAKKKAEEEEARRKAEEKMRLAALPYIELQPMLDACSDVWGRNWDEWTPDDFRQTFNIQTFRYDNGLLYEADKKADFRYSVMGDEGVIQLSEVDRNNQGTLYGKRIIINSSNSTYEFSQLISPGKMGLYIEGNLYDYALDNGIANVNSFISFCGVDDLNNDGDSINVLTDYGEATMILSMGEETNTQIHIYLNDGGTDSVISFVALYEEGNGWGTWMEICKYME